jgi:hypothetical protein
MGREYVLSYAANSVRDCVGEIALVAEVILAVREGGWREAPFVRNDGNAPVNKTTLGY